jgi:DNA excision repair protein ERCC-4
MADCKCLLDWYGYSTLCICRLSQVQALSRRFEKYVLLIEFDPDKPFYLLQSRSASALKRSDLSPTDLISKLVLLLLHYPKLKLLWTSGPKLTCDIFYDLKRNEPDPNEEEAASSSVDSGSLYNEQAKDLLLKLPGISPQNFFLIVRKYTNVAELVNASKRELVDVLGLESGGKLYDFINAKLE